MALAKVTSAEVAARAGVSQSAVSRVFTPGASASAKTVEKVREAAEALGYRPNVLAPRDGIWQKPDHRSCGCVSR